MLQIGVTCDSQFYLHTSSTFYTLYFTYIFLIPMSPRLDIPSQTSLHTLITLTTTNQKKKKHSSASQRCPSNLPRQRTSTRCSWRRRSAKANLCVETADTSTPCARALPISCCLVIWYDDFALKDIGKRVVDRVGGGRGWVT
jgi:hypothetical protein